MDAPFADLSPVFVSNLHGGKSVWPFWYCAENWCWRSSGYDASFHTVGFKRGLITLSSTLLAGTLLISAKHYLNHFTFQVNALASTFQAQLNFFSSNFIMGKTGLLKMMAGLHGQIFRRHCILETNIAHVSWPHLKAKCLYLSSAATFEVGTIWLS